MWDTDWSLRALLGRGRAWARVSRRRHTTVRILTTLLVLLAAWTLSGGAAAGQTDTVAYARSTSTIDGLAWTGIKDSYGVPLSNYIFATETGVLDPKEAAVAIVLGLLFAIFMVIVISGIWLTGFVASFGWLAWLEKPFTAVADGLTGAIATPLVLTLSVTIGAFFVAWFVVRGHPAKAVVQVVAMLVVAVVGAAYLAHPLAAVFSSDGLLSQGRDVGIAVAAGLNGNSTPDPQSIVAEFNGTLADNFARRPVQVWNLGHVVDDSPRCRAAWSSAVLAAKESQLAEGMRQCGDTLAHDRIQNPSIGQIGTGLVLLICGTILLLFLVYLSIKIFLAAVSAIFHGTAAIVGFAAGGFIYGPSQAFLVRNLVGMVGDAGSMVVLFVFEGGYVLVLGSVFRAAPGSGLAVIFVGGIVLVAGFVLLHRLDLNLIGGQSRIAEKIRAVLEGRPAPAGGASTGMGEATIRQSLSPGHAIGTAVRFAADFNGNPVASWMFGRPNPLTYYSRRMQEMNYLNYELLRGNVPPRTAGSWMARLTLGKNAHDAAARAAVTDFDGVNARAAAAAMTTILTLGGDRADAMGALAVARFPPAMRRWAAEAHARTMKSADENPVQYGPLAQAAAALDLAESTRGWGGAVEQAAHNAQFAESAVMFHRLTPRPLGSTRGFERDPFASKAMADYNTYQDFLNAFGGTKESAAREWAAQSEDKRRYIGYTLAERLASKAQQYERTPNDTLLAEAMDLKNKATYIDLALSGTNIGPWTN